MSASGLVYPAFVFWEEDIVFVQILRELDFGSAFEWNDVHDETLTGWDSRGRRFSLGWNKRTACPRPILHDFDLNGLEKKVEFFNQHRADDDPYFAHSEVVDGNCSPLIVNRFLGKIRELERYRSDNSPDL